MTTQSQEKKYYAPSIEEFHVGFEYEENRFGQPRAFTEEAWAWDNAWHKCSVEEDFATPPIIHGIDSATIRVKYLDEEDILAEGWKHDFNDDGEEIPSLFAKHGFSKGYHIDTQNINDTAFILYHFPNGFCLIEKIFKNSGEYIFKGTIRNRSELRQIMRMTGIAT